VPDVRYVRHSPLSSSAKSTGYGTHWRVKYRIKLYGYGTHWRVKCRIKLYDESIIGRRGSSEVGLLLWG